MPSRSWRRRWAVAGGAMALVLAGGVAWAAIPSAAGVYTGCYSTTSNPVGRLRVIDPSAGQACVSGETQITWNAKGLNWRGTWSSTVAYRTGDAVLRNGSSYIAIAPSTNNAPPNTTYWNVLAQKGATGPAGAPAALYVDKQEVYGPLPATLSFTGVPAGRVFLHVEGTAYASVSGRYWVYVTPSGNVDYCGASSRYPTLFFSQVNVHATLMPMEFVFCYSDSGDRTIDLQASSPNLQTDSNDFFTVTMTVYPSTTPPVPAAPASKTAGPAVPGMTPG